MYMLLKDVLYFTLIVQIKLLQYQIFFTQSVKLVLVNTNINVVP